MYVIRWKEDQDYYTGNFDSWEPRCKRTMLFDSVEEARNQINRINPSWIHYDKTVVEYMHPLNLVKD